MKKVILAEVSSLERVMQRLYDRFTVHKEVVHLHGHQQCYIKITYTLIDIHATIDYVHTWTMRYKGGLLHLHKMMSRGWSWTKHTSVV